MAKEVDFNGRTRQEVIQQTLDMAGLEAVSLGEIISDGQMFDLAENELVVFVRQEMLALLGSGAHIVDQSTDKGGEWAVLPAFDLPNDEAVEKVMQLWAAKGRDAAFLVWFYRESTN
ncbi:MAG: hypothetical protein U1C96_07380 [Gallionella sp.]|nr:hypothetical protein [Gallionella sp.]